MCRHGPVIAHCTDSEDFPKDGKTSDLNFDIDNHGINCLINSSSAVVAATSVVQNEDVYGPTRVQSYTESVVP